MRRYPLLIAALLLLCAVPVFAQSSWIDDLGGTPCPNDSAFTCITITAPLDYTQPENGQTLDVTFAVLPAAGESRGMFVTVTGGPGTSGIALADNYASYFDDPTLQNYDIVFFDQRGIGLSGGLDCPNAYAAYIQLDASPTTPEGEAAYTEGMRTFAQDCQAEMNAPDLLPYLATTQAVNDLEQFRQAAGSPLILLYGESYGTQYVQTYAAKYPDSLSGVILDGVVDLTLEGPDFYVQQAQAFSDVLTRSLEACDADPVCSADMGGSAVQVYDDLAAELGTSGVPVAFPLPDGSTEDRRFTLSMLELDAAGAAYGRGGRAAFLRELAAAAHGDLLPLMRDFYVNATLDPLTLEPVTDPTYYSSMYYAIECSDYNYFSGTPDERAAAYIRSGDAVDASIPRLSSIYYGDMPCVFWDSATPSAERPAPFTGGDYVTFVLNSSTDPATPTSNGYAVYDRLQSAGKDAYMITMEGGPHVLYGRHDTCPDVAVNAWMNDGVLPSIREFVCPGSVIGDYTPLSASTIDAYAHPLDALLAVDTEILNLPEYSIWYGPDDLSIGCPFGGSLVYSITEDGELWTLTDCAFIDGFALTGTMAGVYEVGGVYDVIVNGNAEDHIVYTVDTATGMYALSGTYHGETLATPRLLY
ncbi:MAG: alpha/beta fold hydrolase [Anaerolineae bacterium]